MAKRIVFTLVVAGALTLGWAGRSVAQDETAAPVPVATEEPAPVPDETSLGELWRQGGWAMYPLALCAAAALGLTIYGFVSTQEGKMLSLHLVPSIMGEMEQLNVEGVKNICNGSPCLMTNTLHAGMERVDEDMIDVPSVEKAMEEASVHEITAGLKPINYLSIIAQVAPMLGLLGTVSGMIKAFQKIGAGGMGKPELLAENIGEAMVTTATGLIIAIPAMFFFFFLKSKFSSNVSELNRVLGNLTHNLVSIARRDGRHIRE